MKMLALDTSTDACSAALNLNGTITELFEIIPQQHSQKILYLIKSLLYENKLTLSELDVLAFGQGPGSFTGLRIAAAVTQALSFALDIPIVPISTLDALALKGHQQFHSSHILAAIDARMHEVYWNTYTLKKNIMVATSTEQVNSPENVIPEHKNINWLGIGTGWRYKNNFIHIQPERVSCSYYPSAYQIAELAESLYIEGKTIPPEEAIPVYLRNQVAKKKNIKPHI